MEYECAKAVVRRELGFKPSLHERERLVYGVGDIRGRWSREESVLLAQLRVGHCSKTSYWRQRWGLEEARPCGRCGEEEGKEHWLCCAGVLSDRVGVGWEPNAGPEVLGDEGRVLRFLRRAYPQWWSGGGHL